MFFRLMPAALVGLSAVMIAGCSGGLSQGPEGGSAVIPEIDLEQPAAVETATFALG